MPKPPCTVAASVNATGAVWDMRRSSPVGVDRTTTWPPVRRHRITPHAPSHARCNTSYAERSGAIGWGMPLVWVAGWWRRGACVSHVARVWHPEWNMLEPTRTSFGVRICHRVHAAPQLKVHAGARDLSCGCRFAPGSILDSPDPDLVLAEGWISHHPLSFVHILCTRALASRYD